VGTVRDTETFESLYLTRTALSTTTMTACCIGGVCIPYSAILPLLAILIKYLVAPLVRAGLLPPKVASWFGVNVTTGEIQKCNTKITTGNESCDCVDKVSAVTTITSEEHWNSFIQSRHKQSKVPKSIVIAKFTATWCKPCKAIDPHFQSLASKYANYKSHSFVKVDVDEVEEVASQHKVVMMPTFLVIEVDEGSHEIKAKYSGSDKEKLQEFVEQHAGIVQEEKKDR